MRLAKKPVISPYVYDMELEQAAKHVFFARLRDTFMGAMSTANELNHEAEVR